MATVAEIDLELKMLTEKVRENIDISYGKENTIQDLLQELSSEYELDTESLDVILLDKNSSGTSSIFQLINTYPNILSFKKYNLYHRLFSLNEF